METVVHAPTTVVDVQTSGVSWAAIIAGAVVAAALGLVLLALGAGLGLASVSPWADSGVSATTFKIGAGIYLCLVAVMTSAVGGYLAARLRTRWTGLHTNEVFFRDTAHGLIAWAVGILLTTSVLAGATTKILGAATQGATAAAAQATSSQGAPSNPADIYVDRLFRTNAAPAGTAPTGAATGNADATRSEVLRLWTSSTRDGGELAANDKVYVARLVAARTGMSPADAEKRVDEVVTEAKAAADNARQHAKQLEFWLTASLLLGAFAASLAAVEGGQLRDGTWNDRVLTPPRLKRRHIMGRGILLWLLGVPIPIIICCAVRAVSPASRPQISRPRARVAPGAAGANLSSDR